MPASTKTKPLPKTFHELNALFPLRPINDAVDFDNAEEVLDRMLMLKARNKDQDDYLTTLTTLIEKYESESNPVSAEGVSGLDALRYLMDAHQMTASDLGRLLGERSLGTRVLNGDRQLSKAHISTLADHFKVSKALFMD